MGNFKVIKPEELNRNVFDMVGKEWMLVTAGNEENINTMTASWGGMGVMWGKKVVFVVIRPERYTKKFIDNSETMSLTFYNEEYRKTLSYLGTVSGKDENKVEKSGLTKAFYNNTPFFEEANTTLIVRKLYKQDYDPNCFIDKTIDGRWHPQRDYHTMYICEILDVLSQE